MPLERLRKFVQAMTALADARADDNRWFAEGRGLLLDLVRHDDWLPESFAAAGPTYRQNLLHCDPIERFSIVSFVWGPGQKTPIHNHTVWGLVGVLRGEEISTEMLPEAPRAPRSGRVEHVHAGEVVAVGPSLSDVHRVANALADRPSISIHVYGANIGAITRQTFDPETSEPRSFVSGYSNEFLPNLWDPAS